ncbi:ferritin [Candidatus Saccharibacteria bacterium]|nr:ferritin [Candidatus Saccharibacteria bacterium]
MNTADVINLLNGALVHEVEAVLTYMKHFLVIKECKPSREIEEIAVDEMRHAEWLGELIVELGGEPQIEHATLDFGGRRTQDMLSRDVELEQEAIDQYQEHIDAIGDRKIKKLLTKIRLEEEEHLQEFQEMIEEE